MCTLQTRIFLGVGVGGGLEHYAKSNKRGPWEEKVKGWVGGGVEMSIKQKEKGCLETRSNLKNDLPILPLN